MDQPCGGLRLTIAGAVRVRARKWRLRASLRRDVLREWIGLAWKRCYAGILGRRLLTWEPLLPWELRLLPRNPWLPRLSSRLSCRLQWLIRILRLLRLIRISGLLHGNGLAWKSGLPRLHWLHWLIWIPRRLHRLIRVHHRHRLLGDVGIGLRRRLFHWRSAARATSSGKAIARPARGHVERIKSLCVGIIRIDGLRTIRTLTVLTAALAATLTRSLARVLRGV